MNLKLQFCIIHKVRDDPKTTDGWEYAQSFRESFHPDDRRTDCLRRRRWLREIIVPETAKKGSSIRFPVFKVRAGEFTRTEDNIEQNVVI